MDTPWAGDGQSARNVSSKTKHWKIHSHGERSHRGKGQCCKAAPHNKHCRGHTSEIHHHHYHHHHRYHDVRQDSHNRHGQAPQSVLTGYFRSMFSGMASLDPDYTLLDDRLLTRHEPLELIEKIRSEINDISLGCDQLAKETTMPFHDVSTQTESEHKAAHTQTEEKLKAEETDDVFGDEDLQETFHFYLQAANRKWSCLSHKATAAEAQLTPSSNVKVSTTEPSATPATSLQLSEREVHAESLPGKMTPARDVLQPNVNSTLLNNQAVSENTTPALSTESESTETLITITTPQRIGEENVPEKSHSPGPELQLNCRITNNNTSVGSEVKALNEALSEENITSVIYMELKQEALSELSTSPLNNASEAMAVSQNCTIPPGVEDELNSATLEVSNPGQTEKECLPRDPERKHLQTVSKVRYNPKTEEVKVSLEANGPQLKAQESPKKGTITGEKSIFHLVPLPSVSLMGEPSQVDMNDSTTGMGSSQMVDLMEMDQAPHETPLEVEDIKEAPSKQESHQHTSLISMTPPLGTLEKCPQETGVVNQVETQMDIFPLINSCSIEPMEERQIEKASGQAGEAPQLDKIPAVLKELPKGHLNDFLAERLDQPQVTPKRSNSPSLPNYSVQRGSENIYQPGGDFYADRRDTTAVDCEVLLQQEADKKLAGTTATSVEKIIKKPPSHAGVGWMSWLFGFRRIVDESDEALVWNGTLGQWVDPSTDHLFLMQSNTSHLRHQFTLRIYYTYRILVRNVTVDISTDSSVRSTSDGATLSEGFQQPRVHRTALYEASRFHSPSSGQSSTHC